MTYIENLAVLTKQAANDIAGAGTIKKNELLRSISASLIEQSKYIIKQNKIDIDAASANGVAPTMIDRLTLTDERIYAISESVKKVIMLQDPIGEVIEGFTRPNGLEIIKKRVPLGIIGIIYESRPNVTVDAAVLCLKASNAVILRGGKEAINSNRALVGVMKSAVKSVGLDENIIALVEDTSRESATQMMQLDQYIDVLIPRGGAGLISSVVKNATVPVIETGVGNCHVYVDKFADLQKSVDIVYNAKVSRPSVCNACENLLVHEDVAKAFLPRIKKVFDESNVKIFGCEKTQQILGSDVTLATDADYKKEFLDYIIAVKVVKNIDEAIKHIEKYSTKHSEAIITEDLAASKLFTDKVDAAAVYVNASTRFTDGEEFGFGAEIGISTQKLHARGPMGLKELTSTKYVVLGNGQVR